jgi:hypothetical protein
VPDAVVVAAYALVLAAGGVAGWLEARSAGARPLSRLRWRRLAREAAGLARDAGRRERRVASSLDTATRGRRLVLPWVWPATTFRAAAHAVGAAVAGVEWRGVDLDPRVRGQVPGASPAARWAGRGLACAAGLAAVHLGLAAPPIQSSLPPMTTVVVRGYFAANVGWLVFDPVVGGLADAAAHAYRSRISTQPTTT